MRIENAETKIKTTQKPDQIKKSKSKIKHATTSQMYYMYYN